MPRDFLGNQMGNCDVCGGPHTAARGVCFHCESKGWEWSFLEHRAVRKTVTRVVCPCKDNLPFFASENMGKCSLCGGTGVIGGHL